MATLFDLLEKGRHETESLSDEEAAAKRIERFVMDEREFFCRRHRAEFPTFMKVLEAMPVDQFAYRPHERSPSALDVVWTLANEMAACTTMIDSGEVRWDPPPAPLPREALRVFRANYGFHRQPARAPRAVRSHSCSPESSNPAERQVASISDPRCIRCGRPLTSQAIGMLLRNQLYAGIVDVPEYGVRDKRGDFEPLISEDLLPCAGGLVRATSEHDAEAARAPGLPAARVRPLRIVRTRIDGQLVEGAELPVIQSAASRRHDPSRT